MRKMDSLIIQSFILFMRHLLLLCIFYDFTLFSFFLSAFHGNSFWYFTDCITNSNNAPCLCNYIFLLCRRHRISKNERNNHEAKFMIKKLLCLLSCISHSLFCCTMRAMKKRLAECDEHKTGRERQQWKGENLSHLGEFSKEWENYSDGDLEFQVALPTIFSIHFRPLLARWSALSLGDELEFHFVNENNQSKCDSSDSQRVYIKKNYIAAALGKYLRIIYQTQNDLTSSPSSLSSSSSAFSLLAQI